MKIPRLLKICGLDYEVIKQKKLHIDQNLAGQ